MERSPTVRIVPILTTPADTTHTLKAVIGSTRDQLRPKNATPSCAARAGDVQNAKDRSLAMSTAKIMSAARCDLCARRHEKACSVVRADRTRARGEQLVGWRALVPVAAEDGDVESRKQRSKIMTWDRELERTCSHGTRAGMCSMEHRHRQRERVRANGWLRAYVSDAQKDVDIDSREHLVERLTWRSEIEIRG